MPDNYEISLYALQQRRELERLSLADSKVRYITIVFNECFQCVLLLIIAVSNIAVVNLIILFISFFLSFLNEL